MKEFYSSQSTRLAALAGLSAIVSAEVTRLGQVQYHPKNEHDLKDYLLESHKLAKTIFGAGNDDQSAKPDEEK